MTILSVTICENGCREINLAKRLSHALFHLEIVLVRY